MTDRHPFDVAIALEPRGGGRFDGSTHPAYDNWVGPFGGVTAAQALQAVLLHPDRLGDPVALTVNYAAAVADGPFCLCARPARTNRSTQHWTIEMEQQGQRVVTATAVFGWRRPTWGADECAMPAAPPPDGVERMAEAANEPCAARYERRYVEGAMPRRWNAQDSGTSHSLLWCRDDPPRRLDFASLAALCDVSGSRLWRRRARRVPVGTVSMTTYFHADATLLAKSGEGRVLMQVRAHAFRNGFSDQSAHVWSETGSLLAASHQIVYYKA